LWVLDGARTFRSAAGPAVQHWGRPGPDQPRTAPPQLPGSYVPPTSRSAPGPARMPALRVAGAYSRVVALTNNVLNRVPFSPGNSTDRPRSARAGRSGRRCR
jgi:hypothetical protein